MRPTPKLNEQQRSFLSQAQQLVPPLLVVSHVPTPTTQSAIFWGLGVLARLLSAALGIICHPDLVTAHLFAQNRCSLPGQPARPLSSQCAVPFPLVPASCTLRRPRFCMHKNREADVEPVQAGRLWHPQFLTVLVLRAHGPRRCGKTQLLLPKPQALQPTRSQHGHTQRVHAMPPL